MLGIRNLRKLVSCVISSKCQVCFPLDLILIILFAKFHSVQESRKLEA